jgi:Ala-tRNA(Pro) deacylase
MEASMSVPAASHGVAAVLSWTDEHLPGATVIDHEPTFAARDEARVSAMPAELTAKTLVVRDGERMVAAVIPASDRLDIHKLRALLGDGRGIRLATEAEIAAAFPQFEVGAVPPIGEFDATLIDQRLLTYNRVLIAAGDHRHGMLVDIGDLVRVTGARVEDLRA